MSLIVGHRLFRARLASLQASPAPAYGFFGPEHIGKRGVAEAFAHSLVPQGEHVAHPDIVIFDARAQTTIEELRAFLEQIHRTSAYGGRRACLIDHADDLGTASLNALLKDIEEPRAGTVFLLIASRPEALPATVRSRLVPLLFSTLSLAEMTDFATSRGLPASWAASALGRPGLLLRREANPAWWERTEAMAERVLNVFEGGRVGSLVAALDDWQKTLEKNAEAEAYWRIMLLLAMSRWCARPRLVAGQACVDAWRLLETAIPPRVGMEAAWLREHVPEGRAILPTI